MIRPIGRPPKPRKPPEYAIGSVIEFEDCGERRVGTVVDLAPASDGQGGARHPSRDGYQVRCRGGLMRHVLAERVIGPGRYAAPVTTELDRAWGPEVRKLLRRERRRWKRERGLV